MQSCLPAKTEFKARDFSWQATVYKSAPSTTFENSR